MEEEAEEGRRRTVNEGKRQLHLVPSSSAEFFKRSLRTRHHAHADEDCSEEERHPTSKGLFI